MNETDIYMYTFNIYKNYITKDLKINCWIFKTLKSCMLMYKLLCVLVIFQPSRFYWMKGSENPCLQLFRLSTFYVRIK